MGVNSGGLIISVITSNEEYTVIIVRVVIVIARARLRQGERVLGYRPKVLRRRRQRARPVTGSRYFVMPPMPAVWE